MSEIRFVNLLGDELERAARRSVREPSRRPRRRRRFTLFALGGAVLVSGTALATGLLSGEAERQATTAVACYDGADPDFSESVAVIPQQAGSANGSPVLMCRRELALAGQAPRPLVACSTPGSVAVIPGRRVADCRAAGFRPLGPEYQSARVRAARLERGILALEARADCVPPERLADEVQQLLNRFGWRGWTTEVRSDLGDGPCGSVSSIGGDGERYITGSLDSEEQVVFVFRGASRRTTDLLYSADRTLLGPLFAETGSKCFTFEGLRRHAEELFGAKQVDVTVKRIAMPAASSLEDSDGRWTRYKAGCAVLAGAEPGPNHNTVELQVFHDRR